MYTVAYINVGILFSNDTHTQFYDHSFSCLRVYLLALIFFNSLHWIHGI